MVNSDQMIQDMMDCLGWPYASPGSVAKDASSGIDCSGMVVRAYKLQGATIAHGSNTIYRKHCSQVMPYDKRTVKKGMALFKVRAWTEKYKSNQWYGTDPGDVYHIGYWAGTQAIDSSDGGVKLGRTGWTHMGYLKWVDYSNDDNNSSKGDNKMSRYAVVTVPDEAKSRNVNVRSGKSTSNSIAFTVDEGEKVEVLGDADGWSLIKYNGKSGYMMSKFLTLTEEETVNVDNPGIATSISNAQYAQIQTLLATIEQAVDDLGAIIGRG